MICEKCKKNEAVVFITEKLNGSEKSVSLCSECARPKYKKPESSSGESVKTNPFITSDDLNIFNSIFGSLFDIALSAAVREDKKCPLCLSTYAELAKAGKVGCPECYETFQTELEKTIAGIHSNAVHTGKIPTRLRGELDVKRRIRELEAEQKTAVSEERYERAAQIRDELNTLRGQSERSE